jgi:predicted lipoprotein with Yx(FWY)xxD motif
MNRRPVISGALIGAVVLLGACSSSSKSSSSTTAVGAATSTSAYSSTAQPGAATTVAATTNATIRETMNVKLGKDIVVDAAGRTVYMYLPDGSSKTSKVPAALQTAWPAVVVSGTVIAGSGLSASKLAVDMQPSGAHQVAYGGHLLYTFANDTAPGDANGAGLAGFWFALSPTATKIS